MRRGNEESPDIPNHANDRGDAAFGATFVGSCLRKCLENWLLVVGLVLAIAVRCLLVPVVLNPDVEGFLLPWYQRTVSLGRLKSLGFEISNYAPPYMYLLALASCLPIGPVAAIKAIPLVFDIVAAVGAFKLARTFHPSGAIPAVAALAFLLCPTVLLNGAMWAQSDVLWCAFLPFALAAALTHRPLQSAMWFSLALSIKLQALFFLPALAIAFMARGLPLSYFLLSPFAYLVAATPTVLVGRSWTNVLTIYERQVTQFDALTMNAASIYQWLPVSSKPQAQIQAGVAFAAAACAASGYVLLRLPRRPFRAVDVLNSAFFMAALTPFLLPAMHERYAFASDMLACIVPFVTPALTIASLLLLAASFASYGPYMGVTWMPLSYAALLNVAALVLIVRHLGRALGIGEALGLSVEPRAPERSTKRGMRQVAGIGGAAAVILVMAVVGYTTRFPVLFGPDLTAGRIWKTSSALPDCDAGPATCWRLATKAFFHTQEDQSPWLEYDLEETRPIHRVEVRNRLDSYADRAVPLVVEISDDEVTWIELARKVDVFARWSASFPPTKARYVRLRVARKSYLHLEDVAIW